MSDRPPELLDETMRQLPNGVALTLPAEAIEALVQTVADLVVARLDAGTSPWLTRAQAAEYLAIPASRLEKDKRVPCHRWSGRVLYHRDELDDFVRTLDNSDH